MGACGCLLAPGLDIMWLGSPLYAFGRVSVWSTFFMYMAHVFGFRHFGKLVGVAMTVAACFSLLQYPILYVSLRVLDQDYTAANLLFLSLHTASFALIPRLRQGSIQAVLNQQQSTATTTAAPAVPAVVLSRLGVGSTTEDEAAAADDADRKSGGGGDTSRL